MSEHFKLELVSREDHIKALPKTATNGLWTAGDLLTLSSGLVMPRQTAGSDSAALEDGFLGVALTTEVADANAETNNVHVPVSIILPDQIWSMKVADLKRATDYTIGAGYKIGYIGDAIDYDIDYASGGTARTVSVDESYYLVNTAASSAILGAIVVAAPARGVGRDASYGGRVYIRFNPAACMEISG